MEDPSAFLKVRAELPEGKQVVGSPERLYNRMKAWNPVLEIPETKVKVFETP